VRDASAELPVLLRLLQEVDDLRELRLRLVDAGDVLEGDAVARRLIPLRPRATEGPENVLNVPCPAQQHE
jgi:hypothetical protein